MKWQQLHSGNDTGPGARSSHTLSAVGDRQLLLFGGELQPRTPVDNKLYSYNLDEGAWSEVPVEGSIPAPRVGHAAAALDGCLYVYGGRTGVELGESALDDLWRFDTATGRWEEVVAANAAPPRRSYHALAAAAGKLYLFGGCGAAGRLNDLWEFDTATSSWRQLPSSERITGRGGAGLVVSADGSALFVVCGFNGEEISDTHKFDVASQSWDCPACCDVETASALPPRSVFGIGAHAACGVCSHGGHVVLFGGEVDPSAEGHSGAGGFSNRAYCLDVHRGAAGWHAIDASGPLPEPRGWFAAAAVPEGVVVHGGNTASNERKSDMWLLALHEK